MDASGAVLREEGRTLRPLAGPLRTPLGVVQGGDGKGGECVFAGVL